MFGYTSVIEIYFKGKTNEIRISPKELRLNWNNYMNLKMVFCYAHVRIIIPRT